MVFETAGVAAIRCVVTWWHGGVIVFVVYLPVRSKCSLLGVTAEVAERKQAQGGIFQQFTLTDAKLPGFGVERLVLALLTDVENRG